jgi:aspartyl-tRNA(Asn)/glutamyl-tRNA(Gln) amidotransferase subunit C
MMTVTPDDIFKIGHLARIALSAEEIPALHNELNAILTLVQQLNTIQTTAIAPLSHPLDMKQRLREDEVTATDQREAFLKLAPSSEAGLYLVPQVLE